MINLVIVAPFINKKGGTEKVIAYLIEELCSKIKITLYTSKIENISPDCLNKLKIYTVPSFSYPFIISHLSFFIITSLFIFFHKVTGKIKDELITTHGVDSIYGEVFTAHYCHRERFELVKKRIIKLSSPDFFQITRKIYKYIIYFYCFFIEYLFLKLIKPKLILAVSNGIKNDFIKYKLCPPENIIVTHNPVDISVFNSENKNLYRTKIRKKYNITDNSVLLLFAAGGDWERKGFPVLVDILPEILTDGILFVAGGNKKLIERYNNILDRKNIKNRIIFAGFTDRIEEYYATSDIFVLYSFYEGFSLVTLEASASGLPLILSNVNGTEEILQDEYNGFIVKTKEDLIAKINILIRDVHLREKMGRKSIEVAKKYSKERIADVYLQAYQKIIDQNKK